MSERDCLRCGTRIDGHDYACRECGAPWAGISMLDRPIEESGKDEAVVWVLGAMIALVGFFVIFVGW